MYAQTMAHLHGDTTTFAQPHCLEIICVQGGGINTVFKVHGVIVIIYNCTVGAGSIVCCGPGHPLSVLQSTLSAHIRRLATIFRPHSSPSFLFQLYR